MRRLPALVFLPLLLCATVLPAQGTLVVSQNKCALDKQSQVRQMTDSLWIPIAQELVNEGKLTAAGSAYHNWGDEWNVVVWYTATNVTAFHSAFTELFSRVNQRHPTLVPQFFSWCSEHKDNIYSMGKATTPAPATPAPRRE
jgi:hypothetical protein